MTLEMIRFYYFLLLILTYYSIEAQDLGASKDLTVPAQEEFSESFQQLIDSSNNFYFEGNYRKSLEVNILLLKKALTENDLYNIHRGYRHLGYDYLALENNVLAEESFEKSEKFAKLSENDTATAMTYMDMANLYATLKEDYPKAFEYHDKSISLFKQIKDTAGLANAHYNAILTAFEAENYSKAFLHLIKAKKLRDYGTHSSYAVGVEILFGEYYVAKQNFEMADIYLTRAIEWAKEKNLTIELQDAYELYSKSLFEQGLHAEAYNARLSYESYYEENLAESNSEEVEAMSAEFQISQYRNDVIEAELENMLQAEIVKSQNRLNIILTAVSVCAVLLFLAILYAFRRRKRLVHLLKNKNREYLKAKKESERLAKAKGKFFSTVSHELRTPLYGVIGLSTILLEDETLKSHVKDLKSLKFSADYLLALINNVLQINKMDSKNLEDDENIFNLRELFESITASFEYMRLQNNNRIHIIVSEDVPKLLKGNSIRLSQILMNLVGNACKFTENGTIYIKAVPTSINQKITSINFSVQDTGLGIAKEKFSTIFDEFSQLKSINYSYQGTGLGLPIVKKLLALSDSEIEVQSELGRGSTFSFTLSYEVSLETKQQEEIVVLDVNSLTNKRILIAEDNRINQTVTKKILEKNGVICTIAENGLEAVNCMDREPYDLILMDLNMPVKNGFDATKEIRVLDPVIPIIALTAVEIEEVRNEIYEAGMNDIIVKPYDVNKFIQIILKNLNEKGDPLLIKSEKRAI
jgi:signal transduction histidine kinase/ActR/RegA family two-component response regulator